MKKIVIEENVIQFIYNGADLFNNVSLKTSYKSRFVSEDGRVVDEMTMMDDDKDAFEANLEKILPDIHERIIKLTSAVEDAYSTEGGNITIKMQNNNAYNANVLGLVDASIYDCLETGSIKEWYSICGKSDYEREYAEKFSAALARLSNRMFQLKKKTIRNTLGNLQE